ncbi:MAG: ABC-type sugar transport system, periplasmic component [Aeromicrobium sp.]|nr:ABC-type sugar transport system, periplasmic component [Aeromicrobium sp.]
MYLATPPPASVSSHRDFSPQTRKSCWVTMRGMSLGRRGRVALGAGLGLAVAMTACGSGATLVSAPTNPLTTTAAAPPQLGLGQAEASPTLACRPPATDAVTAAPLTLTMWSGLPVGLSNTLLGQVASFNGAQSAVHIDVQTPASGDGLINLLANGERPDILVIGMEALVNLADSGLVTDAQRCINADPTFDPSKRLAIADATYQLRGEQVAMPLTVSTPVMYYDRNAFIAAGLNPDDPPRTVPELRAALTTMLRTGAAKRGLAYGDASWFISQWAAQLGVEIADHGNGHDVAPGTGPSVALDDPQLREVLDELRSMATDGLVVAPPMPKPDNWDLLALLKSPEPAAIAFHTSGSVLAAYGIENDSTGLNASVGVAPLPGPGSGSTVGGSALWITTPDQNKVWGAWQAIRSLTGAAAQAEYGAFGYAPADLTALDDAGLQADWAARPGLRVGFDQLLASSPTGAHLSAAIGTESMLMWRLNWLGEDLISAPKQSVQDSIANADRDINTLLDSYNALRYGPA